MESGWNYNFFILLASVGFCYCHITCNESETCVCNSRFRNTEIQCPRNTYVEGGFVLLIEKDTQIKIDCFNPPNKTSEFNNSLPYMSLENNTFSLNMNLLPNITVENIYKLEINFCPLPAKQFKSICDRFSAKDIEILEFEGKKFAKNITLTAEYFEGLQVLQKLTLNNIGSIKLDENIFVNTPNLTILELRRNKLKLESKVFQHTLLLRSLDLSQNELGVLPKGLVQNLTNLKALYLRINKLTEIDETMFNDLVDLIALDLSFNEIVNISENAFKNLRNLERIDVSMNNLTTVSSKLFQGNKNLNTIRINHNLMVIPDYLFSNLDLLTEIEITDCNLRVLPENIFLNSTHITVLNLTNNLLENFSQMLLKGLENLKVLILENNKFENITIMLSILKNLEKIDLRNNEISTIDENAFIHLNNLKEINLAKNRISQIHFNAFNHENLNTLKIIDLSHNKISKSDNQLIMNFAVLQNVVNAEDINLSHNMITKVEDVIYFGNKLHLRNLDLTHNNISNLMIKDSMIFRRKCEITLDWNNLSAVDFQLSETKPPNPYAYTVLSLTNNPIKCSCHNYNLFRYFQNDLPPKIKTHFKIATDQTCFDPHKNENISMKNILPSWVLCSMNQVAPEYKECPKSCSCYWRVHDKSFVVNCSSNNFTAFPDIILPDPKLLNYNQTEVNFEHNNLMEGPRPSMAGYSNVTKMFLSNNRIKSISWVPPKLEVLKLDNNSMSKLNYEVFKILNSSNLLNVTLAHNPWNCDCNAENLTNLLRQKRYIDGRQVYCVNSTTPLINLSRKDLCDGSLSVLFIILPFMCILLISATLAALYYRYQQELKVWLFAKNLCLWWVTEEDLDKDKIYDAFISYSHKDEDFVNQNLLPILEGKEGYKLCVHYRNWIPGEFIAKQVTNSVCESRRTIIVLSNNFLESVWGKLEFRTAHTQAMSEGRARVIVVLFGDVDINSLDSELKMYLKTNTYVKWGDQYFWSKLKYALPHSRKKAILDEKFALDSLKNTSPLNVSKKYPNLFTSSDLEKNVTTSTEAGALLTVST